MERIRISELSALPDGRGVSVETGLGATAATQVYFFDGTPSIRVDRFQVHYLDDGRALFVDAGKLSIAEYDLDRNRHHRLFERYRDHIDATGD